MCDLHVSLRWGHCRGSRLVGQREPIHPEREPSLLPEPRGTFGSRERHSASSQQEKEKLQRLNDRLAPVIERKQNLEQQLNQRERQLEETRDQLQRGTEERDRLELQVENLKEEIRELNQRLDLTPGPASFNVPSTSRHSTSSGGTKRRLYADETADSDHEFHEHVITVGKITLEEVDDEGKFVKVKNTSDKDQSLNGWIIERRFDNQDPIQYKFPPRFTIKAGQTVTIWAGGARASLRSQTDLVWNGQSSWGTRDDIRVTLLSASGEEMARRTLVRGVSGSKSRRGNEDDSPSV